MKKNYYSPLVEAVSVIAKSNMLQVASPAEQIGTDYIPGTTIIGN